MDGSGFDQDPQFTVIWSPDMEKNDEKEQDGDKATGPTETSAEVGSDVDSAGSDRKLDSTGTSA